MIFYSVDTLICFSISYVYLQLVGDKSSYYFFRVYFLDLKYLKVAMKANLERKI